MKKVNETTTAGVFGPSQNHAETPGFSGDFYAPGDARNLWGAENLKGKKKKKRSKKIPLYRRTFNELINSSTESKKSPLMECAVKSEQKEYCNILKSILEKSNVRYIIDDDGVVLFWESDIGVKKVIDKLQTIITEEPFEDEKIAVIIGEANEITLKSPKKDYNEYDQKEFEMGIEVEKEHTNDIEIAKNITANHLDEFPTYYTALKQMEDKLKQHEQRKQK